MVQYRFDCGSGEGLVTVPNLVSDGEWHIIMVERRGNQAEIFLDGQYSAITVAPGINDELNLPSTDVYFGAEVEMYTNGYVDVRKGFHGCMEDIRIYNVRLPVSGSNAVALSQQFEKVEFSCKDDAFSTIGNSKLYFQLSRSILGLQGNINVLVASFYLGGGVIGLAILCEPPSSR